MAADNTYQAAFTGKEAPAENAYAPTLHDTNELTYVTRGVYVGVTGNVKAVLYGDSAAVTFVAVPAGTLLPIRAKQIFSTGTTASSLVALY